MADYQYPDGLDEVRNPALRQLIDKLHEGVGDEFKLWIRVEDYARKISVALLNARSIAVILVVSKSERLPPEIDSRVLDGVRRHLHSDAVDDLILSLV